MTTFFMFGKYSKDGLKGVSTKRTEKASSLITGYGGKLRSVYALLGDNDLVIIADLPGIQEAVQVSVDINKETGIAFSTVPAIPVADFDNLIS